MSNHVLKKDALIAALRDWWRTINNKDVLIVRLRDHLKLAVRTKKPVSCVRHIIIVGFERPM